MWIPNWDEVYELGNGRYVLEVNTRTNETRFIRAQEKLQKVATKYNDKKQLEQELLGL